MLKLPKEIDFANKPASLPNGTNTISAVSVPSNGSSFTASDVIIVDLPSRAYLNPSSIYMRYKVVSTGHSACSIVATPAYTFFTKLETLIGSQVVESINNYGQLNNMIINCKLNNSGKNGLANALGYADTATLASVNLTNANCNGRLLGTSPDTSYLSAPVNCILSNADKQIPLKFMPAVRLQFTVDTIANIYQGTTEPTSFSITNFELCYDLTDYPASVDDAVASMADANGKVFIKSQSYISSGQTLASGSIGNLEYIYNFRLASIKSLFLLPAGTASVNRLYDSFDATTGNGSYQFFVASLPYPQRPISTVQNRAGVMLELSGAFGPAHDLASSQFGISPANWSYATNGVTTVPIPAMFYCGTNTERLSSNSVMLSGVSSQNSPISVRLDLGTATAAALTLQLIALYDAVFEIDVANKQVAILQ